MGIFYLDIGEKSEIIFEVIIQILITKKSNTFLFGDVLTNIQVGKLLKDIWDFTIIMKFFQKILLII